jgi:NADH:ubiquinone oxidoreductase subunit F (NADH-binding)/NADH:ubiquinone oxidoreductase subunit E
MIVQELRKRQEENGYLTQESLRELSESIGEPLHRLHEVASFFPHFRLAPPPKVEVLVCRDMTCHLRGAKACRAALEQTAAELNANSRSQSDRVEIRGVSCLGRCDQPVPVSINDHIFAGQSIDELRSIIKRAYAGEKIETPKPDRSPRPWKIDPYRGKPEYGALRNFLDQWKDYLKEHPEARSKKPSEFLGEESSPVPRLLEQLKSANLRGMGGAGFPAAEKWRSVAKAKVNDIDPELLARAQQRGLAPPPPVKYVVCNGDESEPGTFKDRELLLHHPHLVLEGMILGGLVTGALQGYVYIRHEYHDQIGTVNEAIRAAREQNLCGPDILGSGLSFELEDVFISPGGYICGEQNALLAAMEDRRAEPRNKPPSISVEGFRGQPTLLNNVETFAWVPAIATNGGKWYSDQGVRGGRGLRLVSISGDIARPGVYEVPFGQTVRELIFDTAGGTRDGQPPRAIAASGPSGGFLPARIHPKKMSPAFADELVRRGVLRSPDDALDVLDLPLDIDLLRAGRLMLGGAFVVYGQGADMFDHALNCVEFFRNESCGKCVPCRVGSDKLVYLMQDTLVRSRPLDAELVEELAAAMRSASICGLGQVAANPATSFLKHFADDLARHQSIKTTDGHAR